MKKIIFVIESMNVGGTEKALLSMIAQIPKNIFNITILSLERRGDFINSIPNYVDIIFYNEYENIKKNIIKIPRDLLKDEIKRKKYIEAFKTIYYQGISRITGNYNLYFNNRIMSRIDNITKEYDLAVSYQGPPSNFSAYLVLNKIQAKKKVQWIHSDVSKLNLDKKTIGCLYDSFDKFFVVSNEAKDKFIGVFPQLANKTEVMFNIIDEKLILEEASKKRGFNDKFNGIRILTVGRLSGEKGQALTIPILARLRNEGYNVRWYCVGEGELKNKYKDLIEKYKVEDYYVLLGSDTNPYPYFKECDLYVQSSKFEGYCLTLAEARVFNKPIISTNFSGANEQLINNETGLIVKYDENELYEAIKKVLDSKETRKRFIDNLKKQSVNNTEGLEELYKLTF